MLYFDDQLIKGTNESVGIVSLWTRKEEVAKKVSKDRYAYIGSLYSAERGIDFLVRNLIFNPKITTIIITGKDLSNSGKALLDFFDKGVEEGRSRQGIKCWKIKTHIEAYIGFDIPKNALDTIRDTTTCLYLGVNIINDYVPTKKEQRNSSVTFLKKETEIKTYRGEDIGYVLRKKDLMNVWTSLIGLIMKFGKVSETQFGNRQKELLGVLSVVTEPNISKSLTQETNNYIKAFVNGGKESDLAYTYGHRMRNYFKLDQIDASIEKLKTDKGTRQAVISLWDPNKDINVEGPPCLNHIWLRIRENKLYLISVFRSHDIFGAYLNNFFALISLQEHIIQKIYGLQKGTITVLSESAHIYEESWESANKITEDRKKPNIDFDPRGNFLINVEKSIIVATYLSSNGEAIYKFEGKTAQEIKKHISEEQLIISPEHGMYLGTELYKAELAIEFDIPYKQDETLILTGSMP